MNLHLNQTVSFSYGTSIFKLDLIIQCMKIFFTIVAFIYSSYSFAQFRNTTWGMNMESVKRIETAKIVTNFNGDLTYDVNISDFKCKLEYNFAKDGLIEIQYTFTPLIIDRTRLNQTNIWDKTISNIIEKYGPPTTENSKVKTWDLKNFSIKATFDNNRGSEIVEVSYTPPALSQKDIL